MQRLGSAAATNANQDADSATLHPSKWNHNTATKPRAGSNTRAGVRSQPAATNNRPPSRTGNIMAPSSQD